MPVGNLWRGDDAVSQTTDFKTSLILDDAQQVTVSGQLKLTSLSDRILAEVDYQTSVVLPCARCLEPTTVPISHHISELFSQHPETDEFPLTKHLEIDIQEPIRQSIILNEPPFPLCEENCPGMIKEKE